MTKASCVQILNALASKSRLNILICLREGEMCVNSLAEQAELSQPTLSRHLRQLFNSGLVTMRTEGKFHFFALDEKNTAPFLKLFLVPESVPETTARSAEIMYTWDLRTNVMEWMGDVDKAFGFEDGLFPRTVEAWQRRVHPDDYLRVMEAVKRHIQSQTPFSERYRIVRKDGTCALWLDCGTVLPDASGTPYKWVGMVQEIPADARKAASFRPERKRIQ